MKQFSFLTFLLILSASKTLASAQKDKPQTANNGQLTPLHFDSLPAWQDFAKLPLMNLFKEL